MQRIVVVGYIGGGNIGDEVCFEVLRKKLTASAVCDVLEVARHPLFELLKMKRRISKADAVVFCGGNLLQNETSNRSLYYYLKIIRIAKACGTKVIFASSGIGRIEGHRHLARTARALNGAVAFFGARTYNDALRVGAINGAKVISMPDLAFTISRDFRMVREDAFAYVPKTDTCRRGGLFNDAMGELYLREYVVPFFIKKDKRLAEAISRREGAELLITSEPEEILRLFGKCRFVVTERAHGAILALISGTPAFISDREQKATDLVDEISRRCKILGIKSPLYLTSELTVEKIKELGACRSEFKILLDNLRSDTEWGIKHLIDIIEH